MPEGTLHIDTYLTNLSIMYANAEFVGHQLYPFVPVTKRSNKYPIYGKEMFNNLNDRRSPGAEAKKSRWSLSSGTYFADGHALKDYVAREDQENQDKPPLDILADSTIVLTNQIALNREINIAAQLVTDMTGANTVSLSSIKWDNNANDPIAKLRAGIDTIAKRIGRLPNTLVLSRPVFTAIINNTNVLSLLTGVSNLADANITALKIAQLLGLDKVVVANAIKNTANQGQTASLDWVWGKTAVLAYIDPAPGLRTLSLGATFRWTNALTALGGPKEVAEAVPGAGAQFVERYYWQPNKADVVEVHDYYDLKTVAADAGILYTSAIA